MQCFLLSSCSPLSFLHSVTFNTLNKSALCSCLLFSRTSQSSGNTLPGDASEVAVVACTRELDVRLVVALHLETASGCLHPPFSFVPVAPQLAKQGSKTKHRALKTTRLSTPKISIYKNVISNNKAKMF